MDQEPSAEDFMTDAEKAAEAAAEREAEQAWLRAAEAPRPSDPEDDGWVDYRDRR